MGKGLKIVEIHKRAIYKYVYTLAISFVGKISFAGLNLLSGPEYEIRYREGFGQ